MLKVFIHKVICTIIFIAVIASIVLFYSYGIIKLGPLASMGLLFGSWISCFCLWALSKYFLACRAPIKPVY